MVKPSVVLIVGGCFFIGAAIVIYINRREKFAPPPPKRRIPSNFTIYNYLPNHSVALDVEEYSANGNEPVKTRLVDSIRPKSTSGLTKDQVRDHLKGGNIIKIYTISPKGERKHYTDYLIDLNPDSMERIKALHIGMITTRFIGSTDGLRMTTTSGNAIGGNASVKIHNLSYIPLSLNGAKDNDPYGVNVKPHAVERYLGYLHQGVTLGTIFQDDDNLYPDFQYLEPHSDLYYGVVSDIRQPLSGCWQLEFNDECDYGQTMWPFQEGVM